MSLLLSAYNSITCLQSATQPSAGIRNWNLGISVAVSRTYTTIGVQECLPNSRRWSSKTPVYHGTAVPRTACSRQQQRQEEQFGRLLKEQQQQRKLLMKQQREAEEQMGTLTDDLEETKDAMEGQFQATEASLKGMHQDLTEQLQAGQASLRKEL